MRVRNLICWPTIGALMAFAVTGATIGLGILTAMGFVR